jgi:membrane protein DedA with SNARE-associated domain
MSQWLIGLMDRLAAAPEAVIYLVLGFAAALENLIPPIPADVVVLFGGLLAGRGAASVGGVFLAVWLSNVGGALLVYALGRRFGPGFFGGRWGQLLLRPRQVERLNDVYRRYGFGVILISRFLPMFRAVVPVFAGVARLGLWRTAIPMALASAAWYGAIVYLGAIAGRNFEAIVAQLEAAGRWLWLAAGVVAVLVAIGWWRTRDAED